MSKVSFLVVDDDPVVLEVARARLEDLGFAVTTREQSLGTSTWILQYRPDFVLLDVMMPALTGGELASMLKRRATYTSVILHSSKPEAELRALAASTGALGAISKTSDERRFREDVLRLTRLAMMRADRVGGTCVVKRRSLLTSRGLLAAVWLATLPAAAAPAPEPRETPETPGLLPPAEAPTVPAPAPEPPPAPPASEAIAAATPAKAASALPELPESAPEAELLRPQTLSLYGFLDFGFNKFYTSDKSQLNTLFPSRAGTFVLGNANLFLDAQPYEDWRSLIELRFTNLPHGVERSLGSPAGDPYDRTDTRANDFTSSSIRGSVVVGSVIIERAQTEYSFSDALKFTGGYFFTPFGIWNVDHGTPTLISLLLPSFIADDNIPTRQLGLQASGSFYTSSWELGYHAYVGNNRTPSQVDFRDDKSFGGRLFASSTGSAAKTKFGLSGYYGHGSDIRKQIVSYIPYLAKTTETVSYHEWMAGADASLDAGPFRLRAEGILRRIVYEPGKRDGLDPDHYYENGYVLAAYQLPFAGLEPYVYAEAIHWPSALGDTTLIPSVGLNVHFNPAVQLKTQYGYALFFDLVTKENRTPSDNNVQNLAARLVVSF